VIGRRGVCLALFGACAAASIAVVNSDPDLSLAGDRARTLAIELVAAALPVVAIALAWRRAFGTFLVMALSAWLAAEWNSPGAGPVFTAGLVIYTSWPPLLAAAALRGLDERPLGRAGWGLVGVGAVATVGVLGIASALAFDPGAQGCAACPANLLRIANAPHVLHALGRFGLALAAVWAICFCALGVVCLLRSSRARRQIEAGVLGPAALAVALFGADAVHGFDREFLSVDPTDRALRLAQAGALALIAAGIAFERLRLYRTRARVAQLVLEVGAAPAPGELRARLAKSLGDPELAMLYPLEGNWIDERGRVIDLPLAGPRAVTLVRAREEDVLAVVHERGLLDDPQLVDELAKTARLAIEHEHLQAVHCARLEELRVSRERIVAAGDRERRALERDLHDGAQQRLVTVGLAIRLARRHHDEPDLADAEEHLRKAVMDLRELAHGLFPAVLAGDGLAAAIDALSERAPRLMAHRLPEARFPDAVESAAYFAASEALRLTDREVSIDAVAEDGCLRMAISVEGPLTVALSNIQDRGRRCGRERDHA
jgi:signal transduction histidine kinase